STAPPVSATSRSTTAPAPFANTSATYLCPSLCGPRRAKNRSPLRMVRESTLQPVTSTSASTSTSSAIPSCRATHPSGLCMRSGLHVIPLLVPISKGFQHFPRRFAVVKMNRPALEHLICFVALARDQDYVAGMGLADGKADRLGSI